MQKKFIELPEKKTVIAMLEKPHTIEDELNNVDKKVGFILHRLDFLFGRNKPSNPYFKSVAKCSEEDSFDINIGRKIAGQKVDNRLHKAMIKQYNRYINMLEDVISTLEQLRNEHITKSLQIEEEIRRNL